MTLGEQQRAFTANVGRLICWAYENGYELTFGDAWRSPQSARLYAALGKGIADSLHCDRLAVDLNLFVGGQYRADSEAYRPLGDYWKTLHPLNRWGGDFRRVDGNHFSMQFEGRA